MEVKLRQVISEQQRDGCDDEDDVEGEVVDVKVVG